MTRKFPMTRLAVTASALLIYLLGPLPAHAQQPGSFQSCEYRLYFMHFPPDENGHRTRPPVVNGVQETDDSFRVTVKRAICKRIRRNGKDVPGSRTVTWTAKAAATAPDMSAPEVSHNP